MPSLSASISATQHLTRDLAERRGRLEMPAYAMMAESMTSGTVCDSFDAAVGTVQSWLSLTVGAPIGLQQSQIRPRHSECPLRVIVPAEPRR